MSSWVQPLCHVWRQCLVAFLVLTFFPPNRPWCSALSKILSPTWCAHIFFCKVSIYSLITLSPFWQSCFDFLHFRIVLCTLGKVFCQIHDWQLFSFFSFWNLFPGSQLGQIWSSGLCVSDFVMTSVLYCIIFNVFRAIVSPARTYFQICKCMHICLSFLRWEGKYIATYSISE